MDRAMKIEEAAALLCAPRRESRDIKRAIETARDLAVRLSFVERSVADAARALGCEEKPLRRLLSLFGSPGWEDINVLWFARDRFMITVITWTCGGGDEEPPF